MLQNELQVTRCYIQSLCNLRHYKWPSKDRIQEEITKKRPFLTRIRILTADLLLRYKYTSYNILAKEGISIPLIFYKV